jgi:hypothetical protein
MSRVSILQSLLQHRVSQLQEIEWQLHAELKVFNTLYNVGISETLHTNLADKCSQTRIGMSLERNSARCRHSARFQCEVLSWTWQSVPLSGPTWLTARPATGCCWTVRCKCSSWCQKRSLVCARTQLSCGNGENRCGCGKHWHEGCR